MNPPLIPPENNNSFAHKAANASLLAVGFTIGLLLFLRNNAFGDIIAGILILGGFIAAMVALVGISEHGTRGLLGRGVAGLLSNGLLIIIFIVHFSTLPQSRCLSGIVE